MSWHQNGPGSKAYELFSGGMCEMGHEACYPTKWIIVRPIPAHRLWQFDGERYEATAETWHNGGKWVESFGFTRTQTQAKIILESQFQELL